jgi:hypothetical protein
MCGFDHSKACCPIIEDYILGIFLLFMYTGIWHEMFFLSRGIECSLSFLNFLKYYARVCYDRFQNVSF